MPSIDHLTKDRMAVRAVDLFTGDRGRAPATKALLTNLARLVDRSLVLYDEARALFDEDAEVFTKGVMRPHFKLVAVLEDLIERVHRATLFAAMLSTKGHLAESALPTSADREEVQALRHAIQHADERLVGEGRGPDILPGQPIFPKAEPDEVILGSQALRYDTIVRVMESLHAAVPKVQ